MPSQAQDEWIARVLNVRRAGASSTAGQRPKGPSLVAFAKARLVWQAAKANVATRLESLRAEIEAGVDAADAPLMVAGLARLDGVLGAFDAGLADTLDALVNAGGTDRAPAIRQRVEGIVARYLDYVGNDPVIAHLETSPAGKLGIAADLRPPLEAIRAQLAAR
jgi:hypothetical protein